MKVLRRAYRLRELAVFAGDAARLALDGRRLRNLALVEASARLGLEECRGLPLHVFVEVSGDCNYRCVKCARHHPRFRDDGPVDGGRRMSYERFARLLDEIGDTLLTTRLWHYGEPLLHPDLPRMVRAAKGRGVFVAVSTNGSLLVPAVARDLVDAGLDYLIVSFDAGTRETYRLLHGADAFDAVQDHCAALSEARRAARTHRPFLEFQVVVHRQNEAEVDLAVAIGRRPARTRCPWSGWTGATWTRARRRSSRAWNRSTPGSPRGLPTMPNRAGSRGARRSFVTRARSFPA